MSSPDLGALSFNEGPFPVNGTPFALSRQLHGLTSEKIITRDGARDAALTAQLYCKFGGMPLTGLTAREIAAWLREVHASEQPKKLVFIATEMHDLVDALVRFVGSLPGSMLLRMTIEEVKP